MSENKNIDPKEFLIFGLKHFEIDIVQIDNNVIHISNNYQIEIEGNQLYKLLHEGAVIAPFNSVEELCNFVKQDMKLNE